MSFKQITMEYRTFFSDETEYFRIPAEPDPGDTVRIRFRTGRYQADGVSLFCLSKEESGLEGEIEWNETKQYPLHWEYDDHNFDFYSVDLPVSEQLLFYYFKITTREQSFIYDRMGILFGNRKEMPFSIDPGYHTPVWSKGCLYYQIFPDRFCNSDPADDVKDSQYIYGGRPVIQSDWGAPVLTDTYRQFYGGDLKGVIEKLSYLHFLGVEALYLNPVFASPSSHKYDCCDYEHVDMGLAVANDEEASNAVLSELIEKAHELDIRVILDGVFNHCSCAHPWFGKRKNHTNLKVTDGAYQNPGSVYHDRFRFLDDDCLKYEAWWDVPTLPKLNYEGDPTLSEDICSVAKKWISKPYGADGWRLDVGADLAHSEEENHRFWQKFRKAVRECRPDSLILAEHYEDPSAWLNGKEWDAVMNYNAFMDPVSYFFTGMEKHSDVCYPELKGNAEVFKETLQYHSALFPGNSLLSSLNQLDNHDHSRFLTRTNGITGRVEMNGTYAAGTNVDKSVLRQAAGFMYFWPGCPGLYYGDEVGLCGFTDPDNRRCFPWDYYDKELLWYFEGLGKLRKEFDFVKTASNVILHAKDGVFAYSRFTKDQAVNVIVSQAKEEQWIELPLWMSIYPGYEENRVLKQLLQSDSKSYSFERKPYIAHNGIVKVRISPGELLILA